MVVSGISVTFSDLFLVLCGRVVAFPQGAAQNQGNSPLNTLDLVDNPFLNPNQQLGPQVFPTQRPRPSSSTTDSSGTTTTTASPAYTACLAGCNATPQYNPVCGSDRVTYNNMGRLRCANQCGNSNEKPSKYSRHFL